jgi:hypothetical protein
VPSAKFLDMSSRTESSVLIAEIVTGVGSARRHPERVATLVSNASPHRLSETSNHNAHFAAALVSSARFCAATIGENSTISSMSGTNLMAFEQWCKPAGNRIQYKD